MVNSYSTQNVSPVLVEEIVQAMKNAGSYGSIEIYIQNHNVTQITVRNIKKTTVDNHKYQNKNV